MGVKKELVDLIQYRLKQAHDSLEEARILLKEGMSKRAVINRLYYAMFYAVLALLQEKQMGTSKHIGAISLFDKEFIKTGVFDKDLSKTLHRAFELRQKGDYMELMDIGQEDVQEIFPKAVVFVEKVERCLLVGEQG
ncbi:MAG: HEPN domain-containing protein [Nitrospirae bacterium]|nr:HEPN domain-containing protein [Nitrospirota bacterium]